MEKYSLTFDIQEEVLALAPADPVGGLAGVGARPLASDPLEDKAEVREDDPVLHVLPQLLTLHHGQRKFRDTNPKMSSLLVNFVWGDEAIL
jgi:hypothetical protein